MTIIEALESGAAIRRPERCFWYLNEDPYYGLVGPTETVPGSWWDADHLLQVVRLTRDDLLAKDWEAKT